MKYSFQSNIYRALLLELGKPWLEIQERIEKAVEGKDVLIPARIKEEIANLVELSVVRDTGNDVYVMGFPEPLVPGELFVDPETKLLEMVMSD